MSDELPQTPVREWTYEQVRDLVRREPVVYLPGSTSSVPSAFANLLSDMEAHGAREVCELPDELIPGHELAVEQRIVQ
jgi:hypothetical protein